MSRLCDSYLNRESCSQERVQADLPAARVRDGDHLGDARLHPHSGRVSHCHGAYHTFYIRPLVSGNPITCNDVYLSTNWFQLATIMRKKALESHC